MILDMEVEPEVQELSERIAKRGGLYFTASMVGLPGVVVLSAMLGDHVRHPEQSIEPMLVLVFRASLLFAVLLIVRVAQRGPLDGDLI